MDLWIDWWFLSDRMNIRSIVFCLFQIVEGAAGVAIAAYVKTEQRFLGQNVVIISCGANISMKKLKEIVLQWD